MSIVQRVFFTLINILPETIDDLVMAACIIHNLLRDEHTNDSNENYINMELPKNMMPFNAVGGNYSNEAFRIRELFKNYFNSGAGSVNWQTKQVDKLRTFHIQFMLFIILYYKQLIE